MPYKGTDTEREYMKAYMARRRAARRLTVAVAEYRPRRTFKLAGHCQRCGWSLQDAARVLHSTGTDAFCAECCSEIMRMRREGAR